MVIVDESVLADPARLAAVGRAHRVLPSVALGADAPVRLAARLLGAPSARLSLVGRDEEHLVAGYGPPAPAVGRYVVSAGATVDGGAFLGTPVRDGAGRVVGALAVLDTAPRGWTAAQATTLAEVAALLEPPPGAPPEPPGGTAHFLGALMDSLPVGVIACADDGAVVLVNRAVREFLDLPAEGAPQDQPDLAEGVLFDPRGRPIPWRDTPLQRAARGERAVNTDMIIRVPGRRERVLATTAQAIEDSTGRRLGAVAIAQEVTALRRAERFRACHVAVGRALQSAGSAEEAAPGVLAAVGRTLGWPAAELWLAEEDGGDLRHAGGWSAPGSGLDGVLGHPPVRGAGITGRVWASGRPLFVPDIADTVTLRSPLDRSRAAACLRHGIRTVLAVPVRDGNTVLGVLTCYAGAPEHQEDLLTVLLDGVAAQIGVHVARRRAEQLAHQLTRAKDDFIALAGHEMRTPLTSIVASASMLGEDAARLDEESRALVEAVHRNATGLRDVVDTLLDLAGLDSGYLTLTIRRVDLTAVVAEAAAAAGGLAAASGVHLRVSRTEPLWVSGDPRRLRQVVDDLLTNAVRYSPQGGDVRVDLGEPHDGLVEMTVADHGLGTPAEERDRLFERFYRASNVRHQGIAGSGLGLSLARTIVHRHGGTIRLTGRRPQGTTVVVRLPATGPRSPSAP